MSDVVQVGNPAKDMLEKEWKPFPKQKDFLSVPFSIFEGLFGGAAGPGKSESVVLMTLYYGFHLQPNYKGITLRRTLPDLEKEIILRQWQWYPHAGGLYNERKARWTFPSGAIEQNGHAEHKEDIRRYDSVEYNLARFEEATHFLEFQYLYLIASRVRSVDDSLPAIVRNTTNPGNVGHSFFRKRFVDPCPDGYKVIKDKRTGQTRIYIPARVTDNPLIMEKDPQYIRRLELLPEAERRAKLYGDWYTYEGQVFVEFRPDGPFPGEPPNANHVVVPFAIPDWWPKVAVCDWGFAALTWFAIGAISPDGRLYVYNEKVFLREHISVWAGEIGKILDQEKNVVDLRLDSNAWQNTGEPLTIAEQFERHSGYRPAPADKGKGSRISGKILFQEYLRFYPKPQRKIVQSGYNDEIASKLLRFHGTEEYHRYLDSFKPEDVEGSLPKLQIFSDCRYLIDAIPNCIYDPDNTEDVKEFDGDDPYDGARYLIRTADAYMKESKRRQDELARVGNIMTGFEQTHDYNALYRRMEVLEAEAKRGQTFGVKRYDSRFVRR